MTGHGGLSKTDVILDRCEGYSYVEGVRGEMWGTRMIIFNSIHV